MHWAPLSAPALGARGPRAPTNKIEGNARRSPGNRSPYVSPACAGAQGMRAPGARSTQGPPQRRTRGQTRSSCDFWDGLRCPLLE
eukprot:7834595-Alexandrium_andersonii.AAC.1